MDSLEKAIRNAVEKESVGIFTERGIDEYAEIFGMNRQEFLSWIAAKKRVLDIGSGGGLLKKELRIARNSGEFTGETEIVSFDLAYATPHGKTEANTATHLAFTYAGVTPKKKDILGANRSFWETAVAGSFGDLPFPNQHFDGIIACFSFGIWTRGKHQTIRAFDEVARVMKKNAEGLISIAVDDGRPTITTSRGEVIYLSVEALPFGKIAVSDRFYHFIAVSQPRN